MMIENKTSPIMEEYNAWVDEGGDDKTQLPILIIIVIHNHQSLDGYELLPKWLQEFIEEELEFFRKNKEYKVGHSGGIVDHSEKMKTLDRLFRELGE